MEEQGIDIVGPGDSPRGLRRDGEARGEPAPAPREDPSHEPTAAAAVAGERDVEERDEQIRGLHARLEELKRPELDLTVEPSLDSLRLYLRNLGRVPLLSAEEEVSLAKRIR